MHLVYDHLLVHHILHLCSKTFHLILCPDIAKTKQQIFHITKKGKNCSKKLQFEKKKKNTKYKQNQIKLKRTISNCSCGVLSSTVILGHTEYGNSIISVHDTGGAPLIIALLTAILGVCNVQDLPRARLKFARGLLYLLNMFLSVF